MTIKERKEKLEEVERLVREAVDIAQELYDDKPEHYGWEDIDEPLGRMQSCIYSFIYKVVPKGEYSAIRWINEAQKAIHDFEEKRDLFNSTKIPED